MPISKKLRLAYVAEWLLAVPVSAVPVEHSPVVAEGDSSMVVMHEKREENLEALKKILGDPVRLDHELVRRHRRAKDSDDNGDSDRWGDSSNNSSVSLISLALYFKLNSWYISLFSIGLFGEECLLYGRVIGCDADMS